MRKKTAKKGSLFQETSFQLILLFVSFILLALLISRIFAGAAIQDKICQAVPWLCGAKSNADYAVSERSGGAFTCAAGSAFTGGQWQGSGNLDCREFYESPAANSGQGSGDASKAGKITAITGAASGETLTLSQARSLKPSVSCSGNTCTVRNFVMPQEVTKAEDWIPYWGDPQYLIYWGSFPQEEDTWNFKVHWTHHVIIGVISVMPVGKTIGLGFKTISTAVKGPGTSLVVKQASKTLLKQADETVIRDALRYSQAYWVKKGAKSISNEEITKIVSMSNTLKAGTLSTELEDSLLRESAATLSKLSKDELRKLFGSMEMKMGRGEALKMLMREDLKEMLKKRLSGLANPKADAKILGKFAIGEVGLYALADSSWKKYEQTRNGIAVKTPGIDAENMKIFDLPQQMEKKPVVVKWNPEGNKPEIKQAHFVSPCYLSEFNISKVNNLKCGTYKANLKDKTVSCSNGEISNDAPIVCGELDKDKIDRATQSGMVDDINDHLKMADKKLFQTDESGVLKKIYLPWLLSEDKSSPRYYLENIQISEIRTCSGGGTCISSSKKPELEIDKTLDPVMLGSYDLHYRADLSCGGKDCVAFKVVTNLGEVVMSSGKEYVLFIDYFAPAWTSADYVPVDIYDLGRCTSVMDLPEEYYPKPRPCDMIKNIQFPSGSTPRYEQGIGIGEITYYYTVTSRDWQGQVNEIKNIISKVLYEEKKGLRYYVKITPAGDIRPENLNTLYGITDCGNNIDSRNCFRVLTSSKINAEIVCTNPEKIKTDGKLYDYCRIQSPNFMLERGVSHEFTGYGSYAPLTFSRHISYDSSRVINDITYSSLSIQPSADIEVQFSDNDEAKDKDGNLGWDSISLIKKNSVSGQLTPDCLFGSEKVGFGIELSDISSSGDFNVMEMENCKTEGVVISFKGDRPQNSKLNVEGPNYCLREQTGVTRVINTNLGCGATTKGVASILLLAGSSIAGDGLSVALMASSALLEAGGGAAAELDVIWPG